MLLRRPMTPSVSAPLRHVSRTARRSRITGAFRPTTWGMLAFLLVFPIVTNITTTTSQEAVPIGIRVGDVFVGGMSAGAARDAVVDRVQALTTQPAQVTINDQIWAPLPAELGVTYDAEASIAALASSDQKDDQDSTQVVPLAINFNPAVFTTWIDSRVEDLGGAAVNASLTIDGVEAMVTPGTSGVVIDREMVEAALLEQVSSLQPISFTAEASVEDPTITTEEQMAQLGITEVVGVGDSVYAGSGPGRTNNVEVAAYMVDGTLVPPGEVFSFNAAVGDLFNGMYMDAGSYLDGPNGQSLAGGVCQVSTTVFRAALDAGFPIEEWWQHSYRSPFYEMGGWSPGFDAAIVQDSVVREDSTDLQFRNTTDSWLMVSAKTVDGELKVELLGADTGYAVTFDEPVVEVIEWATDEVSVVTDEQLPPGTVEEQPAMDGLRVTVVRYVHDAEGNLVSEDTFVSTYGSYGAIRRVSPDMAEAAYGQ